MWREEAWNREHRQAFWLLSFVRMKHNDLNLRISFANCMDNTGTCFINWYVLEDWNMFDSSLFRYPWSKSPKKSPKKTFWLTFIIEKSINFFALEFLKMASIFRMRFSKKDHCAARQCTRMTLSTAR